MNNFDILASRKGTNSYKWDTIKDGELPMFIADQDFLCFKPIFDTLERDIKTQAYGYTYVPDDYFRAYHNWFLKRYNVDYDINKMQFSEGVVATISSCVRHLLNRGDKVTVLTPVYNIFYNSILNNGCKVVECALVNNNYNYMVDFESLEDCLKQSKMMILCNPQNPVGKIFSKEELAKIGELTRKYNCILISDEIHCDFVTKKELFNAYLSASPDNIHNSIICIAPSKTFNIAGLKSSVVYVNDDDLRYKVQRAINTDEVAEPNMFAINPVIAAYNEGGDYVDQMNEYIYQNKLIVQKFLKENLPHVGFKLQDSLYLVWLDLRYYSNHSLQEYIRENSGLILSDGEVYGYGGLGFVRMNLATSKENVIDGLNRLKASLDSLVKN